MEEKYEKKIVSTLPSINLFQKEVSNAPSVKKIFGYDIYTTGISNIEWTICCFGLKGVRQSIDNNLEITTTIDFLVDSYKIAIDISYFTVFEAVLLYEELMLDSDIDDMSKLLSEGIIKEIDKRIGN
jgi:hypothetical protein